MNTDKNNNDRKRNRILFDFESIVDVKLSHIYDLKKYHGIVKGVDLIALEDDIKEFKYRRIHVYEDPIKRIYGGHPPKDLNLHIMRNPVFTTMKTLAREYLIKAAGLIYPTVLCKDRYQERIIKNSVGDIRTLIGSRSQVKTINFSRIVLGDINHLDEFKDPITVDFMILNFRENMMENDPMILKDIALKYSDVNSFTIANAYNDVAIHK